MKSNRFTYLVFTLLLMFLGITSRKINEVPLFIGDVLYAVLIYFGFRFLFINCKKTTSLQLSLLFCFGIETLQLVQLDWLIDLRKTTLGHYILGEGFLWSDLVCYVVGNLIAFLFDKKLIRTQNSNL